MVKHVDKPCRMDGAWILLCTLKCDRILFFFFLETYKQHSATSVDTTCIMCKTMFGKNA